MIEVARMIDDESRTLRKTFEAEGDVEQQAQAIIGKARFAIEGTSTYPDATFTLRLAYGQVKGYEENGASVPALTTIAGLYQRSADHGNREPFDLPARMDREEGRREPGHPVQFREHLRYHRRKFREPDGEPEGGVCRHHL